MSDRSGKNDQRLNLHNIKQFKSRHGPIVCRDLLGFDINDNTIFREAKKPEIPQKICPTLVQDATETVETLI